MHLTDLKWSDVDALPRETPVVIPVAALEQHGRHMPLFTDSMLLGEVIRRAHERLADRILLTPLLWLGNSEHHLDFPGTMTAAPRTYLDVLEQLAENFLVHGFRRIVFVNGHGGNHTPGQQAVFELRQRRRQDKNLLLLFSTYWLLGAKPHEVDRSIQQQRMGHACEWETSMMLRLAPHLVGDLTKVGPVEFGVPFEPASRGWVMPDRSEAGHIGDPRPANADKGESLFRLFSDDVTQFLERVIRWDGTSWSG